MFNTIVPNGLKLDFETIFLKIIKFWRLNLAREPKCVMKTKSEFSLQVNFALKFWVLFGSWYIRFFCYFILHSRFQLNVNFLLFSFPIAQLDVQIVACVILCLISFASLFSFIAFFYHSILISFVGKPSSALIFLIFFLILLPFSSCLQFFTDKV